MPRPYIIQIDNGTDTLQIVNGTYDVTASATGYNNDSISPVSISVIAGTDSYSFTIAATGTLTLHVTETGAVGGTPLQGATFVRCNVDGTVIYGTAITSDENGNAEFPFMPFAAADAPLIYYKQTASVGEHDYDGSVQSITMTTNTRTIEVTNAPAALRTITLNDANYPNLPIGTATITLS